MAAEAPLLSVMINTFELVSLGHVSGLIWNTDKEEESYI